MQSRPLRTEKEKGAVSFLEARGNNLKEVRLSLKFFKIETSVLSSLCIIRDLIN